MIEQIFYFGVIVIFFSLIFAVSERIMNKIAKRKCHYFDFSKESDPKCDYCDKRFFELKENMFI